MANVDSEVGMLGMEDMDGTRRERVTCRNVASLPGSSPNFCADSAARFLNDSSLGVKSRITRRSACSARDVLSSNDVVGGRCFDK